MGSSPRYSIACVAIPCYHTGKDRSGFIVAFDVAAVDEVDGYAFVPVFFAPFWDTEALYASVDNLRRIDYETLCPAHFGPVRGDEAKAVLDRAVTAYEQWWGVFEENEARFDETGYLLDEILEKTQLTLPPIETVSPILGVVLGLMTAWNKLIHGKSWSVSKIFLPEVVEWLVEGHRTHKGR